MKDDPRIGRPPVHPPYRYRQPEECLTPDLAAVIMKGPREDKWSEVARLSQNLMWLPQAPVEVWYWLAMARRFQKLYEQAEAALCHALRREPGYSCAWWLYGKIELERKQPAKAIPHFCRAIALEPSSGNLWPGLAIAYEETGHLEAALAATRRCIALGINGPITRERLTRVTEALTRQRQLPNDGNPPSP